MTNENIIEWLKVSIRATVISLHGSKPLEGQTTRTEFAASVAEGVEGRPVAGAVPGPANA